MNASANVNLTNLDTFTVVGSTFIFDGTTNLTAVVALPFNNIQIGDWRRSAGSLTLLAI